MCVSAYASVLCPVSPVPCPFSRVFDSSSVYIFLFACILVNVVCIVCKFLNILPKMEDNGELQRGKWPFYDGARYSITS